MMHTPYMGSLHGAQLSEHSSFAIAWTLGTTGGSTTREDWGGKLHERSDELGGCNRPCIPLFPIELDLVQLATFHIDGLSNASVAIWQRTQVNPLHNAEELLDQHDRMMRHRFHSNRGLLIVLIATITSLQILLLERFNLLDRLTDASSS